MYFSMDKPIIARSFGTHDGSFHADEVTACALLLLTDQIDRDKVFRTRQKEKLETCEYVCDVGGIYDPKQKRFDHHQSDYQGNLSSAGMVLKYLKEARIIDESTYKYFNRSLVKGVDAIDNGKMTPQMGHCTFSAVIANFVPAHHDAQPSIFDAAFFQAVDFTYGHLSRLMKKLKFIQECRIMIKNEMEKNQKFLMFDRSMPWIESFFELGGESHPAKFLIMPTGKQWKLRGIPPSYDRRMEVRVPLPQSWAGLIDEELKERTQIPGAVFCHKGRFISVWETKEDALKALEHVLKEET